MKTDQAKRATGFDVAAIMISTAVSIAWSIDGNFGQAVLNACSAIFIYGVLGSQGVRP